MDWCKGTDHGLLKPDAVLFIDLAPEVAQARSGYGQERYEKVELQTRVRKLFGQVMQEPDQQGLWTIIDGDRTIDAMQAEVREVLAVKLQDISPSIQTIDWI